VHRRRCADPRALRGSLGARARLPLQRRRSVDRRRDAARVALCARAVRVLGCARRARGCAARGRRCVARRGRGARCGDRGERRALTFALAVVPWLAAAMIRWIVWGRPAPLAVLAKPSDLAHGLGYVGWAFVFSGAPIAAFAPFTLRRLPLWPRVLALGAAAHF